MYKQIQDVLNYPFMRIGEFELTILTIFFFCLIVLAAYIANRYIRNLFLDSILKKTRLDTNMRYIVSRLCGYIIFALGILIGLETLGIDLTSFTILAGAFGLGIGFGLQNIINNFVSGLIILSERLIQIEDRIEVGGYSGTLKRVGARSSVLHTSENVMVIVPNSEFITGKVVNWGHGTVQKIRFDIVIGVSYDSDLNLVKSILLEVADANEHVLKQPAPEIELFQFGDSSIDFKLYVWTVDMVANSGALKSQLYFSIWEKFREHQIDIPFPIQSIRLPNPVQVEFHSNR